MHEQNNYDNALLKCTSSYPAPIEEANLIMIKELKESLIDYGTFRSHRKTILRQ